MKRHAIIYVLLIIVASLQAVNHMDLLTRIDGEFNGSKMGHTMVSLDYNGDGYQDLVASAPMWNPTGVYDQYHGWGKLYFYMGGPGFSNIADYSFPGNWDGQFVGWLNNAGDVNGDGKDDFLMYTNRRDIPGETGNYSSLYVFYGRDVPTGQPDFVYNISEYDASQFGVTPLGDINNDGYDDLGMRKQVWSRPYHDFISVILGGINGPDQIIPFRSTYAQDNMLHINGIGDVNADGIDDFHLLFHGNSGKRFTVFYGNSSFPDVDSLVVCDNIQDVVMYEACPVGDVNGDGIDDFASAWGTSGKLWFGSANFNSEWDIEMPGSYFGAQGSKPTLRHGDFNNDGIEDIVGSDYDYGYWNGRIGIWLGHQQFNGTVDLIINYPQYQGMQFGWAKAAGDFNADGFCDLAVSSPYLDGGPTQSPGFIYIFAGNAQLIDTTVDVEDELAPVPENIWELNTYPNPFRGGSLSISLSKVGDTATNPDQVSLYNLKGQIIMKSKLRDTDWQKGTIELNIPDITNGVYLVLLSDSRGRHTSKKIVIAK